LPKSVYETLELLYSTVAFIRLYCAWRRFRPDVLYERLNLFQPAGVWLKTWTGVPLLVEVNSPLVYERSLEPGIALRRLAFWSERLVLKKADRVLAVSRALKQRLEASGVCHERIEVVPNGANPVAPSKATLPAVIKLKDALHGRTVIGFLGFVRSWHKIDWVIELILREGVARNLHLLIVGEHTGVSARAGADLDRLKHRMTVTGPIPFDEVYHYLSAIDVAVQPGSTEYASPIKIFEYMAAGRAIIAPDQPNIREILDDTCAVLFEPERQSTFDAAVLDLCENPWKRDTLGRAAKRRLLEGQTWRHAAERVKKVAEDVLVDSGQSVFRRPGSH